MAALALVLLLMRQAGRPAHWNWLFALDQSDSDAPPGPPGSSPEPQAAWSPLDELLSGVRDDVGFRSGERQSLVSLWLSLEAVDSAQLESQAVSGLSYAQLLGQPASLRGQLVRLQGTVRRARRVPLAAGLIREFYELWLSLDDEPELPVVVYCRELPEGFPVVIEMAEPVRLAAVYFKRWPYQAQSELRTAPLLVARDVAWHSTSKSGAPAPSGRGMTGLALFTLTGLLVLIALRGRQLLLARRRPTPGGRAGRARAPSTPLPSAEEMAAGWDRLGRQNLEESSSKSDADLAPGNHQAEGAP